MIDLRVEKDKILVIGEESSTEYFLYCKRSREVPSSIAFPLYDWKSKGM